MTRDEADAEVRRLTGERPDTLFAPRETAPGAWEVVEVSLPMGKPADPLKATIESRPRPDHADDPRGNVDRDVGGPYAT